MLDIGSPDYDATDRELDEWRDAATRRDPPMQVKLTIRGEWHKPHTASGSRIPPRSRTACGKVLGGYATRDDSLEGPLCLDGCFSPFEIASAAEDRDARAIAQREADRARHAAEDAADFADELARRRRMSEPPTKDE